MVRGWWREAQVFIKRNLIGLISVILAALLGIGAWALWSGEISYTDPGPAIAAVGLAMVILLVGLAINNFQAQNQDLQAQNRNLQAQNQNLSAEVTRLQDEVIGDLQTQNQDLQAQKQNLSAEVTRLREELKQPSRLPSVIGLEVLVNRWQEFKPELDGRDSATMYDQLLIAQQLFNQQGAE